MDMTTLIIPIFTSFLGGAATFVGHKLTEAGTKSLFSSKGFEAAVTRYCNTHNYSISRLSNDAAKFTAISRTGRTHEVRLVLLGDTVRFIVLSCFVFHKGQIVSNELTRYALRQTSECKLGAWSLEAIDDLRVLAFGHNAELTLINAGFFKRLVDSLMESTEDFENVQAS